MGYTFLLCRPDQRGKKKSLNYPFGLIPKFRVQTPTKHTVSGRLLGGIDHEEKRNQDYP